MTQFPNISTTLDVEAIDCSCGLEQSTSVLFAQLQGFVEQYFICYFIESICTVKMNG